MAARGERADGEIGERLRGTKLFAKYITGMEYKMRGIQSITM